MLQTILTFTLTITLTILFLLTTHWFPWNRGARPLSRLTAYAIGTLGIVGIPVAAMLLTDGLGIHITTRAWAGLLMLNTLAAGASVHIAYYIDNSRALNLDDHHAATRDQ